MTKTLAMATDLWRSFQRDRGVVAAVQGCSFKINAGETIAIMGPSGCGKTTLLNLIAGLDIPSSGRVEWPGLGSSDTLRPERIGVVFQSANLMPALTAVENVELPILLGNGSEAEARALAALAIFSVEALAGKLPEQLSGGQAERIAVARAIVTNPELIVADEPTGQLDQAGAAILVDRLLAWGRQTGSAIVIATHDERIAAKMNRIWRMRHGKFERVDERPVCTGTG
ncbi:ABC transporter ATP-binding protein [Rhizobium leguminosarum]|uniref:ATP-binding cassette domain-containing protein n=1 Tax=Rhizobium leguminosarum TaxID=384 RepID=A0A6P0B1A6_RHILE|nr:ABC transporter ATP-binding protein [Rhizobium leguminosarum]MBY5440095.1 ABC transporter ATP-binding protein [Rhizobium leguminosarum]NEI32704.1 ATP-binding cassette domain-containing protein [Rhizobium leguminosarum]NEI39463.1 ATP-binding cassette domain-containing protein [Rhizobium leguminosarum]